MNDWLGNFAYSINLPEYWWIFIVSAVATIMIAVFTVTYQAVKAALTNPVDAIKYE
jgi:putative ABC transport system permease protein